MLGDEEEAGGEDGGGSGDVEGIVRVTACADYIALQYVERLVVVSGDIYIYGGGAG